MIVKKEMFKKASVIFIIILVTFIAYNLIAQIFTTLKAGDRVSLATQKLNYLQLRNESLKKSLEEVKTGNFIEQQARDKLGLAKAGETIVIIPDEKIDLILGQDKNKVTVRLPNYLGWWKLFF